MPATPLEILEEKVPPHNLDAEMALLGAMLLSEDARLAAFETVRPEFFYRKVNGLIYRALQEIFEQNQPCDLVALADYLNRKGQLTEVGGQSYLVGLIDLVPSPSNIGQYARIIREHHVRRILAEQCSRIIQRCYHLADDVDLLLDQSEQAIFDIVDGRGAEKTRTISTLVHDSFERLTKLTEQHEHITGLPTGIEKLDNMTSGFQDGDLVIIAARPSMGKTALACTIARHLVVQRKTPVAFFSLEMSCDSLVQRLMCAEARINLMKLRTGRLSQAEWTRLTLSAGHLSESKLFIDDTAGLSPIEIRAKARRLVAREGVKIIFVDYLQLIRTRRTYESRQQEMTDISASLKNLAKELGVPVVALSQLSREPEKRDRKTPQLSDLRESGAIEQDADLVIMLVREERYFPEKQELKGLADVHVAKQRNGPTGDFKVSFINEYATFENLERYREES